MVLWKGRLQFKQYIPLKRSRFGIKIYCLCEDTGYTYRFHVYTGKENPNQEIYTVLPADAQGLAKTEQIVVHLMLPLLDKGYQLYTDNFYTSERLCKYLDAHCTGCCGTVRSSRVPPAVRRAAVRKGETAAYRSGNILCVKYSDKRDVYMMSNLHQETTTRKRVRGRHEVFVQKPDCIIDYNNHMGGVDRIDQMLAPYNATRKTLKWYRKLAVHFIQLGMLNAYILYEKDAGNKQLSFLKFQSAVIEGLLSCGEVDVPKNETAIRLSGRHFLEQTPMRPTGNKRLTKRCRVCYKKGVRKDVVYICAKCPSQPALCPIPCFQDYHTKMDYSA